MFSRYRNLWAILFALLIAGVTIPRAQKLQSPDFKVFYVAARHALESPELLYTVSPDRYLYPPSTAILLTPFAFTGNYPFHQWCWHGLLALLVFGFARSGGAALAALVLLTRYLAISFGYGQINLVVMGLMAGAGAWCFRRPGRAGALWALAVSLKVYPLVLAPAFLAKHGRKGFLTAAIAGLGLAALPLVFWGPALGVQLYKDFFHAIESKGLPLHSHNQSLSALLLRLFTDESFKLHGVGDTQWTLVALPRELVRAFGLFLGITLTACTWWRAWRTKDYLSAAAFSILFLSHIVWKDYLLFLFFPLREIFRSAPRKSSLWLAGVFGLWVSLSSPDVLGPAVSTRLDSASIHLWSAILVWMAWLRLGIGRKPETL